MRITFVTILFTCLSFSLLAQTKLPDYVTEALKDYHPKPGTFTDMEEARRSPGKVKILILMQVGLDKVPEEIRGFKNLETLDLSYNNLSELPQWLLEMKKLRTIDVARNNLTMLPKFIFNIKTLDSLDCSSNNIKSIEIDDTPHNLKEINLAFNEIHTIPKQLILLDNLRSLILTGNRISVIPKMLGLVRNLQKVDLCNNRIVDFDDALISAKNLKLLMIDYNPISNNKIRELQKILPACEVYTEYR